MTLPLVTRKGNCLWHFLQALLTHKSKFNDPARYDEFVACAKTIAAVTVTGLHDTLIEKLLEDFDDEPEAMDWFAEHWCGERGYWYLLTIFGVRSNSGMEALNRTFKKHFNNRTVIASDKLLPTLLEYTNQYSMQDPEFHTEIALDKAAWIEAQLLLVDKFEGKRTYY